MNKAENMLKKGRLRFASSALSENLQSQVCETYQQLLTENQGLDRYMQQHMYYAILPAAAVYRVMQENGYPQRDALRLIRKSVLETAKPTKALIERCAKLPFFFPLFRALCRLSMKGSYCGEEWRFIWRKNTSDSIEWECHACIYFNRFSQYGMKELTPIFCESDDVVYGHMKNVRWGRTQTIGRGAEFCDFKFYRERRSSR